MKKISHLILWTMLFSFTGVAVRAENSTCFMLDADGNQLNLGSLCQSSQSQYNRSSEQTPQWYRENYYQNPQPSNYQEKGVHTIPIKSRRSGIPVIDVKFNDRYTFEMMLDTGASSIVITKQMAQKLRVNHSENVWVSTPSSNYFKMSSGYVYSVKVGKLTQKNSRVITSPTMNMGLLGQSFFSRYDMTIKSDVVEFRER